MKEEKHLGVREYEGTPLTDDSRITFLLVTDLPYEVQEEKAVSMEEAEWANVALLLQHVSGSAG